MDRSTEETKTPEDQAYYNSLLQWEYKKALERVAYLQTKMKAAGILVD